AIIIKAVEDVTMFILQPRVLRTVIDERSTNTGYILMIQDHIGESMIMQREEFYLDFAKKINDRSQRVSVDVVEKIKAAGLRPDAGVEAPVPPSYPRVTPPSILPRPPTPPIPRMAAPLIPAPPVENFSLLDVPSISPKAASTTHDDDADVP